MRLRRLSVAVNVASGGLSPEPAGRISVPAAGVVRGHRLSVASGGLQLPGRHAFSLMAAGEGDRVLSLVGWCREKACLAVASVAARGRAVTSCGFPWPRACVARRAAPVSSARVASPSARCRFPSPLLLRLLPPSRCRLRLARSARAPAGVFPCRAFAAFAAFLVRALLSPLLPSFSPGRRWPHPFFVVRGRVSTMTSYLVRSGLAPELSATAGARPFHFSSAPGHLMSWPFPG